MKSNEKFLSIQIGADAAASHFYRMLTPFQTLKSTYKNFFCIDTPRLTHDINFYRGVNLIRIQRQVSDNQLEVTKFLHELSKQMNFTITYDLDDIPDSNKIPEYNPGKKHFSTEKIQSNIKQILGLVDFITVTTKYLQDELIDSYSLDENKIKVIPNTLPTWWKGSTFYNRDQIKSRFMDNRKRPKIGLPLSSYHFDIYNLNNGQDDITHLLDFIRNTCDKYEWMFFGGYCPKPLIDLAHSKKISIIAPVDVLNYLFLLDSAKLNVIVAPLADNKFNRCKSNIKYLEGWSVGVPVIGQNLPIYSDTSNLVFTDANDLQNQLDYVLNKDKYIKTVQDNYINLREWWLQGNTLNTWKELYEVSLKGECQNV